MISARISLALIAVLLVLRAVLAGMLPLSADEAYYWLWSRHLAAGYFDHPPVIAWLIRGGTMLLGDTPLGVRLAGVLLSVPATWFVWRSAALILNDAAPMRDGAADAGERIQDRAALAALFFNLTLMASVELLAATPDMPSMVTAAAMLWALAKVQVTGKGPWWLAVGVAAGLGLLSKYSALFLGAGVLIWLIADGRVRAAADAPKSTKWLATPWPWLGAVLALLLFAPNLIWQARHHWMTFTFQFARVAHGDFTLRYLGEFLAAQIGLASPLIFVLMAVGLWRATRFIRRSDSGRRGGGLLLLALLTWTGLVYFLIHALHDRVQGNWPCFLYPALAILAADAFAAQGRWRSLSFFAAPLAAVLLAAVYIQALWAPIAFTKDPLARVLGRDFAPVATVAAALSRTHLADAILTTDYETTAWLRFTQPGVKVIQVGEAQRYPDAPAAPPALLRGRLFYLAELRRDRHQLVQRDFGYMGFPTQFQAPAGLYMLYPVGQPKTLTIGKMP